MDKSSAIGLLIFLGGAAALAYVAYLALKKPQTTNVMPSQENILATQDYTCSSGVPIDALAECIQQQQDYRAGGIAPSLQCQYIMTVQCLPKHNAFTTPQPINP